MWHFFRRFFFSHYGESGSFTPAQFFQLRRRRLSDLICENTAVEVREGKKRGKPTLILP